MAEWGKASIDMVADYKGVRKDVDKLLGEALAEGDATAHKSGEKWGKEAAEGMKDKVEEDLPKALDVAARRVSRKKLKLTPDVEIDSKSIVKAATKAGEDLVNGLTKSLGSNNNSNKITQSAKDLIGGIFNISGKSPLTTVLIPALAAIPGLVVAAATALQGLTAAATVVPAILGGLLASVVTLKVAFSGLETKISAAFNLSMKVADFKKEIEGLAPPVQGFLWQIRDLAKWFNTLKNAAQISFFEKLGDSLHIVQKALGDTAIQGMVLLAKALGQTFHDIAEVMAGPTFKRFVGTLFTVTSQVAGLMTPALTHLINSFAAFGTNLLKYSKPFVDIFNRIMTDMALFLNEVGDGNTLSAWIAEGASIFSDLYDLLKAIGGLISTLFSQSTASGGQGLIQFLTETVNALTGLLGGEGGHALLVAFVGTTKLAIYALVGLVTVVGTVIAAISELGIAIGVFGEWVKEKWDNLWGGADASFQAFATGFHDKTEGVRLQFSNVVTSLKGALGSVTTALTGMKNSVTTFFSGAKTWLRDAGHQVLSGFINGIKAAIPDLKGSLAAITKLIPSWKGPEETDRKLLNRAGKVTLGGYISGIESQVPALQSLLGAITKGVGQAGAVASSSFSVSPGAVVINANGTDINAAARAGSAAGAALMRVVTDRAPLLAARTV